MKKFLQRNKILFAILILGFILRTYGAKAMFLYGHDQDLASWFVKDVLVNKHLRLIGQETSTQGIFIGPIYYYLLIPFYLVFNMDPIGGVVLITILGLFSIWSFYFVFTRVFNKRTGLIASFLYAISFYTIFNDREVVPTMPVIVWTAWYLYALDLLLKNKQRLAYLLFGILIGLIWHLNFALALVIPLIPITLWLSKKKLEIRSVFLGLLALFVMSIPLVLFELRHDFSQTKALILSFTTDQHAITSGVEQFYRVLHLMGKDIGGFLYGSLINIRHETTLLLLIAIFSGLVVKKAISKKMTMLMLAWILFYVAFFSFYSKILSEYYLNGTMVVWIGVVAIGISSLLEKENLRKWGIGILIVFGLVNLYRFITININRSGYVERKAVVAEIKNDSDEKSYPCVAVSYITKPGYDLGYRYFFFLRNMHVNLPKSESPVYTIVYPLREDIKVNKIFGHIGLIYPDNSRYTREGIKESCSGENSNLIDPMWGFPQ